MYLSQPTESLHKSYIMNISFAKPVRAFDGSQSFIFFPQIPKESQLLLSHVGL